MVSKEVSVNVNRVEMMVPGHRPGRLAYIHILKKRKHLHQEALDKSAEQLQ